MKTMPTAGNLCVSRNKETTRSSSSSSSLWEQKQQQQTRSHNCPPHTDSNKRAKHCNYGEALPIFLHIGARIECIAVPGSIGPCMMHSWGCGMMHAYHMRSRGCPTNLGQVPGADSTSNFWSLTLYKTNSCFCLKIDTVLLNEHFLFVCFSSKTGDFLGLWAQAPPVIPWGRKNKGIAFQLRRDTCV